MLKHRVERLREILNPNYKLELPEQLAEGTEDSKIIVRSNDFILNPARGLCELVTEPDEDGTGTKVSFKNPNHNEGLLGYGTFGRTKDGKEVLEHNKKNFNQPNQMGNRQRQQTTGNRLRLHPMGLHHTPHSRLRHNHNHLPPQHPQKPRSDTPVSRRNRRSLHRIPTHQHGTHIHYPIPRPPQQTHHHQPRTQRRRIPPMGHQTNLRQHYQRGQQPSTTTT